MPFIPILAACMLVGLSACAPRATVRHKHVDHRKGITENRMPGHLHGHAESTVGYCLADARLAAEALAKNPADENARKEYNFKVARAVEHLSRCQHKPWRKPTTYPGPDGDYTLTVAKRSGADHNPEYFRILLADTLDIGGAYFKNRTVVDGLGAPLVAAALKNADADLDTNPFAPKQVYTALTAVIRFKGRQAELEFVEPLLVDGVKLNGHTHVLAEDLTAPIALYLVEKRPQKFGLVRLLKPGKYADTARLTRIQPYDPKRIPVVFVHGLRDTPVSFLPMMNTLWADPEVRDHFQLWVYSYPSGYPYPYSASLMRDELAKVRAAFPHHRDIVIIGHSMGGLLCRLMITDAGDKIWLSYFGKPPAEVKLEGDAAVALQKTLIFDHERDISRVIFISTPHRGSDIASNWIGRLSSRLVRTPKLIAEMGKDMFSLLTLDDASLKLSGMPNSVETLSPNNRFVKEVNQIPMTPGIPYHSIIGDRGRGDTPNSSDGVVPYWSSHVDGAASERIVPSHHGANRNPEAIAEVRRILQLHLHQKRQR